MVQIPVKLGDGALDNEWTIVELQGDLETRMQEDSLVNKFIGDLHFTKDGNPILIIGHHILHGDVVKLEKPLAVAYKSRRHPIGSENSTEAETGMTPTDVEYTITAIVSRKILFKSRPKPIVSNVAKKN